MLRVRFKIKFVDCDEDYRPVIWPIKYPYWCSGEHNNEFDDNDEYFILVAYVDSEEELYKQWPEAYDLDIEEVEKIEFTGRFQKPKWYKE